MINPDVTDVARRFIQAWNADQRDTVDGLAAPTFPATPCTSSSPSRPEAFKWILARTHRYFPNLSIEVHDIFGVQAAAQSVEVEGVTKYRIEEGRVQGKRGVVDNFGLVMQLGASGA